jgi:hypothetical protein
VAVWCSANWNFEYTTGKTYPTIGDATSDDTKVGGAYNNEHND